MEDLLQWLGEQVGTGLRVVVEVLVGLFAGVDDFFTGVAESFGMSVSVVNILFLVLGVYLLYRGGRRLLGGAVIGGILRLGLGVLLLGWLIS